MKKLPFAFLFFLLLMPFRAAAEKEIILLTSADNPPYEFTKSGEIVGFDIDLAKIIAERLGRKLVIRDMPFASLIPALMSNQGDFAMAAITPTDLKRENVDFSVNYQKNTSAIVLANKDEFDSVGSKNSVFPFVLLEGKTVGVQLGTHHETDIREANIPDLLIKRYDNVGAMVAEISNSANGNGTIYALVIGIAEAKAMVAKNPKLCFFPLQFSDYFAIALRKQSPLKSEINKIIEHLRDMGKISTLETKWDIGR
ncbi:MAG: transporter substrate-binding domain-containing protein [Puniceicoccales bacterium]|nr:transporter substrate-binding domain-containing protein [Puniceicoccales bacterium]